MRLRDVCNLQQCARAPSVKLVKLVNRHAPPQPARMRPARAACRACSSFRACTACRALRGRGLRCGCVCACACGLRACGCVRLGALGVRGRVCVRAACMRAGAVLARVRLRACARVRALACVRSRCSSRQLRFLRRAFGRRVAGEFVVEVRGSSWRFGSGRVGSLKVQVVKVLK